NQEASRQLQIENQLKPDQAPADIPKARDEEPVEPELPGPAGHQASQRGDDAVLEADEEQPLILHLATLTKYEKDKVKRIVTPKPVIFMQRVEILSTTTKSKKIEIKGGFYNEEDMKNELGYSPIFGSMLCEYHEQELEYWVNTRTSGTLSHEDLQKMSAMQSHEGEASGAPGDLADMNFDLGGFFGDDRPSSC
ncbi:unnamed protein product, partial [Durusdinium trenchii]